MVLQKQIALSTVNLPTEPYRKSAGTMNLELAPADEAFRQEVRNFLDGKLTSDRRQKATREGGVFSEGDTAREWRRILFDKGWVAPAWPTEFGGCGSDIVRRYIWKHESAAAGAPVLPAMGLQMCGPVLSIATAGALLAAVLFGTLGRYRYVVKGH